MLWANEGIATAEIAARLGRHPAAIRKHVAVLKSLPPSTPSSSFKRRPGGHRKITDKMKDRLRRHVLQHPFKSAKQLRRDVIGWQKISVRSIQHVLKKELGLPSRVAAKKPLLTPAMVKKRLRFCKKYVNWTEEDWTDVMFSDESTFRIVNSRGSTVRRPRTIDRYRQKYTVTTVKHSASVMIWGCFSGRRGRGGLYFLPKNQTMTGARYVSVLENHLAPFMRIHGCTWFLQDGAPCHKSKVVMEKLKDLDIKTMDWPGNSPDLNPIENCWSFMKAKLKDDYTITSLPKLIEAIKMMWVRELPLDYFQKLASSMPRRIKAVMAAKGQMTKY